MNKPFEFVFRVRYSECDAQGVVFNARYGDYVDLAMTEFLRAALGGYSELVRMGYETQVVRLLTEWKGPARFDEVLKTTVQVLRFGNTSFTLGLVFSNVASEVTVATSEITYVLVDATGFSKVPVPDSLKSALLEGACGKSVNQAG
ncbi:MAG TPA: thioesterase family protein [Limnobacter sp.]|nr:thioesterase family protein [Limnobacter sp.]